jgi:hypothetical protein
MNTLKLNNQKSNTKQPTPTNIKKIGYVAPAVIAHGTLQEITRATSSNTNPDDDFGFVS